MLDVYHQGTQWPIEEGTEPLPIDSSPPKRSSANRPLIVVPRNRHLTGLPVEARRSRFVPLTYHLDDEYQGNFDLPQFRGKIQRVFQWYDDAGEFSSKNFVSPSFAIIQSSGMGKTKLMKQYKATEDNGTTVFMILCYPANGHSALPTDWNSHFDFTLQIPSKTVVDSEKPGARDQVICQLNDIERECKTENLVLLIDEAHLLVGVDPGYYVSVRWWLRQKRQHTKVVACFSGTLLSLANYQRVSPSLGWTRDAKATYVNYEESKPSHQSDENPDARKKVFEPFYTFTTVAMHHQNKDCLHDTLVEDELFDIRKCGYFGRPLFAALLKSGGELTLSSENVFQGDGKGKMKNDKLHSILSRMLLSERLGESDAAAASILATRVQLGIASYDFADHATAKGYANLVHFSERGKSPGSGFASIVFHPDPVCAAMAMGLMHESWSIAQSDGGQNIGGEDPEFWVTKMSLIFKQQMFLPGRGDAGEVFAALFMLLCGDELRRENDICMRKFSIDLFSWLERLLQTSVESSDQPPPKKSKGPIRKSPRLAELSEKQSDSAFPITARDCTVNFIQVVRNYFRTHAWLHADGLRFMYDAAVGCYVFANCPAFDIVFPIKRGTNFHPALVSVKSWNAIGAAI